jgi:fused signal recognition particle receptor
LKEDLAQRKVEEQLANEKFAMLDQSKGAVEEDLHTCREEIIKLKTQLDERDKAKDSMEAELRLEISAAKDALGAEQEAKETALDEARRNAEEIAQQQAQQIADLRQAVEKSGGEHTAQLSQLHKDLEQAQTEAREQATAAASAQAEQVRKLTEEHEHALAERDSQLEDASARAEKLEDEIQLKAVAHSEEMKAAREEANHMQVSEAL